MTENPGYYSRRVGRFTVTALTDGYFEYPYGAVLAGIGQDEAEALAAARFRAPGLRLHINAFLVRGDGRTVLIDTGTGGRMAPTAQRLPASLAAAGVQPGDVDAVLLTHFHRDHSGGLATAEGGAVFPRAELGASPEELGYWFADAAREAAPEARRGTFDAARAAAEPYRARLRPIEDEAFPGIRRVPLPGHTPGHSGYMIADGPDVLLIWGDIMHAPDIQAPRPDVGVVFDVDRALAASTRRDILARAAAERLAVAGMHLHFPGFAHVAPDRDGYSLVPDLWRPEA